MFGELNHHSYLIVGPAETIILELKKRLSASEVIHQVLPMFGIDESRELRERQARAVSEVEERVFILEFDSITVEAQQALLKTLEEPAQRTKFFMVAPTIQMFLPTLLSRLRVIITDPKQSVSEVRLVEAQKFLAASPEERLALVQKLLDQSETPARTRTQALRLVQGLEVILEHQSSFSALRDLEQARSYLNDRAASTRLILEHLAVVL